MYEEKGIVTSDGAKAWTRLVRPEFRIMAVAQKDGEIQHDELFNYFRENPDAERMRRVVTYHMSEWTEGDWEQELAQLKDLKLKPKQIEELVRRHPAGFAALLAPADRQRFPRIGAEACGAAISAARRSCDVVVLHVPRALDEVARAGLRDADRVLVVLGLDLLSFRDAKRAIEVAALEGRCSFVVNRASRSEITPNDVERVFGQPPIAVIPSDRAVARAQDHGRLVPMRGRIGRALDRLARQVLEAS